LQCTSPRTVGFLPDGKTISWSSKKSSKEFASFQLPCGQCLACRLDYARQWAIRCVHESKMHENNCFITLTYSDEHLKSPKLIYSDFQLFMKRLRDKKFRDFMKKFGKENWKLLTKQERKKHYETLSIGYFVTGEYGEKTKRPHWHACLFNYSPTDPVPKYTNHNGDTAYTSQELENLWPQGNSEFGQVTFESAGYCARYAAKKLVHGKDSEHEFKPISKKSARQAIGKKFLEKYYKDVFTHGHIVLENGKTCSIPRYYEKWFKQHHPKEYEIYATETKLRKATHAKNKALKELEKFKEDSLNRGIKGATITRKQSAKEILKSKFKTLQNNLKL